MRKLSGFALFATIVVTTLSLGCSSNPPATAAAAVPASVKPPESSPQPAQSDFIATGPIVVEQQVELATQRDGVISEVVTEAGALVKKGQPLARLDDRQLTADRDAAASKTRSIEADVKKLGSRGASRQSRLGPFQCDVESQHHRQGTGRPCEV